MLVPGRAGSWNFKKLFVGKEYTEEPEFLALSPAVHNLVWSGRGFAFGKKHTVPPEIVINDDWQHSAEMAKTNISVNFTKHIDIKCHFVCTLFKERKFKMKYCTTNIMLVDILKVTLGKNLHYKIQSKHGHSSGHVASCQGGSVENVFVNRK